MRLKGHWRVLLSLLLLIGGGYLYIITKRSPPQICCKETCLFLELARTPQERQTGLMFRETLAEEMGMLFIFDQEDFHSFRMKNTLIPLDMVRLNSNLQIMDIQQAEPCKTDDCPSYLPSSKAQYVLELNQGISKRIGIEIGNQCFLSL